MCGFAGFLGGYDLGRQYLDAMGAAIHHRGPDDAGSWSDAEAEVGFAFKRLSILDLSRAGHQPMASPGGRYIIVFNGEIYNHLDLRAQLERAGAAPPWRGHADTETLLAAFEAWGIEDTIKRTIGMFAFAVWDRARRALTLGRDRVGEKPLYYGWQQGVFLFGSELKAIRSHPACAAEIDRDALTLLMRHNYIPAPYCIYRGLHKLTPGTLLTVSRASTTAQPRPYWDFHSVVAQGIARPFRGSPEEAVDVLEDKLRAAIQAQMISDVPLGAFLSGGIDSSAVVSLMQQLSSTPVRTFSIGFQETGYDEAVYAREVATHLGTDHTELYVSPAEAREVIPLLPGIYCEPFADSSQIPTYLVSRLARQNVTVSLSGDAGDELFAGYTRYVVSNQFWRKLAFIPTAVRTVVAARMLKVPAATWSRMLGGARYLVGNAVAAAQVGDRVVRGAQVLSARDAGDLYRLIVSHWTQPENLIIDAREPATILTNTASQPRTDDFVHNMMALDFLTYLPDDILVKVDRAAMAVSLETRVPFLDHRVVEFAWQLPLSYKLRNGVSKWPLREVLYRYVPRLLIERPKMGFGVPIDHWLRGPLKDWAEDLLSADRLRREGYINPVPIRQKWQEHLSGTRNWHYHLWDVLMFQAWLAAQH